MKEFLEKKLIDLIFMSRNGDEPLDGDEVESLLHKIRYVINLHEGNITHEEFDIYFNSSPIVTDTYTLVMWPESQDFMDEDWFDEEAVLFPDESSAYFIPTNRLI